MPRDGTISVGDLVGRLESSGSRARKCGRAGRYRLERLVAQHRPKAKIPDWIAETHTSGVAVSMRRLSNVIRASNFRLHR